MAPGYSREKNSGVHWVFSPGGHEKHIKGELKRKKKKREMGDGGVPREGAGRPEIERENGRITVGDLRSGKTYQSKDRGVEKGAG